jgi:hypothetical protein
MTAIIVTLMLVVFGGFGALLVYMLQRSKQVAEELETFAAARGFQFRRSMPVGGGPPWLEHFSFSRVESIGNLVRGTHGGVPFWAATLTTRIPGTVGGTSHRPASALDSSVAAIQVEGLALPDIYVVPSSLKGIMRKGAAMALGALGMSFLDSGPHLGSRAADYMVMVRDKEASERFLAEHPILEDLAQPNFSVSTMPGWIILSPRVATKHRDYSPPFENGEDIMAAVDEAIRLSQALRAR